MTDGAAVNRSMVQAVESKFHSFTTPDLIFPQGFITYIMDPKVNISAQTQGINCRINLRCFPCYRNLHDNF